MECPHCRLINPDTTQHCNCGYDFTTKTLEEPYARSHSVVAILFGCGRAKGARWALAGLLPCVTMLPSCNLVSPTEFIASEYFVSAIDGLDYVKIPAGAFQMGCVGGSFFVAEECNDLERPRHQVEITRAFWMSRTEVTVAAYKRFVKETGQKWPKTPYFNTLWVKQDHPIVQVTWDEAKAYCEWSGGRLPTEAEWEYAARGGSEGFLYPWGNKISSQNARYRSLGFGTVAVGSCPANGFGLYDMIGNVHEWCSDWYDDDYYAASPPRDPKGPPSGKSRVLRGGSWGNYRQTVRTSFRSSGLSGNNNIGFRCVREVFR